MRGALSSGPLAHAQARLSLRETSPPAALSRILFMIRHLLAVLTFAIAPLAMSAEVQVLSAGAVEPGLVAAAAQFQRATGHTVKINYATAPVLRKKITDGEMPDVLIATSAVVKDFDAAGRFVAGSAAPVGRVGVGVTVRKGAPFPEIGSTDAMKRSLLAAESLVYNEASTGIYFAGLLDKLGIAADLKPKTRRYPNGEAVMEHVIHGKGAEIGVGAITEINLFIEKGLRYVGPLPADVQNYTSYAAAQMGGAKNAEAAQALVKFLTGAEGRKLFIAAGIE
ncbi:MAG: substrate-binding domain-containing protein [Proteobacteria bacterium]|nr:substrate-binding domain-containing protein [Burkholderiales bacterium]